MPIAEIAERIGITRGAIYQWTQIPAERVGQIFRLTGIAPHIQRPDLFQPEFHGAAALHPNDVDRVGHAGPDAASGGAGPALSQEAAE